MAIYKKEGFYRHELEWRRTEYVEWFPKRKEKKKRLEGVTGGAKTLNKRRNSPNRDGVQG